MIIPAEQLTLEPIKQKTWEEYCEEAILKLADAGEFTADDVWDLLKVWGVRLTVAPQKVGVALNNLRWLGAIEVCGRVSSKRPQAHNRKILVYRKGSWA